MEGKGEGNGSFYGGKRAICTTTIVQNELNQNSQDENC